jgi:hypothetical protein
MKYLLYVRLRRESEKREKGEREYKKREIDEK